MDYCKRLNGLDVPPIPQTIKEQLQSHLIYASLWGLKILIIQKINL